jgi:hypothetical protein
VKAVVGETGLAQAANDAPVDIEKDVYVPARLPRRRFVV